ncbi:MAG: hypothetical protein FD174_778 [Geobacteraceae bacterium]|nr:MAG: hypothetical protein FD174_778 [Geobacteraceae bacterium]
MTLNWLQRMTRMTIFVVFVIGVWALTTIIAFVRKNK